MQKISLYLVGILLIILSYILDFLGIGRLIILILGLFLIDIQVTKNYPHKIIFLLILPIILLVATYGIDLLLVAQFKRIPVFSYEIKSSDTMQTYNSIFYRVYACDKKNVIDYGYQKNYACSPALLDTLDVNAFVSESISEYRHKFVKLSGKISKISGVNILELSPYKIDSENTLNGYVVFNTEYTIRINTEQDLSNFRIYDDITVIGLVNNLTPNTTTINLVNPIIIPSNIYDEYTLEVIENNENTLVNYVDKDNIFLLGLDNIYFHYDENHIYELNYLITDKRVTIKDLIKDIDSEEVKNEEEIVYGKLYKLDKYKVLICENKKTIISNNNQKINDTLCN